MEIGHKLMGEGASRVLVLHGWLGDHRMFEPMFDSLNLESFTYAFMDYRGYGRSKDLAGDYGLDEIVGDAFALADKLGWDWFDVVGHSMGGMAAQRLVADDAQRVRAAVLITPVPASGLLFDEDTWALYHGAIEDPINRAGIVDYTTGNRLSATWLEAVSARSFANSTREAVAGYLDTWMKSDFSARMKDISHRTKVLLGEYDPAITPKLMSETVLAWNPRAEMEVVQNCGHYPMLETPVYLATAMERFLST